MAANIDDAGKMRDILAYIEEIIEMLKKENTKLNIKHYEYLRDAKKEKVVDLPTYKTAREYVLKNTLFT